MEFLKDLQRIIQHHTYTQKKRDESGDLKKKTRNKVHCSIQLLRHVIIKQRDSRSEY